MNPLSRTAGTAPHNTPVRDICFLTKTELFTVRKKFNVEISAISAWHKVKLRIFIYLKHFQGLSQKAAICSFGVFQVFFFFSDSKFVSPWPLYLKNSKRYSTEHRGAICLVTQLETTKCAICIRIYTETIKLCPLDAYVCQFLIYERISFNFLHYKLLSFRNITHLNEIHLITSRGADNSENTSTLKIKSHNINSLCVYHNSEPFKHIKTSLSKLCS